MIKQIQNRVAESRITLPVVAIYGILVWLVAGLITQQWWIQFLCFAATTYMMVEMNNQNALIRIYSRMVSCAFLVLSCMSCFLFSSLRVSMVFVGFVAFLLLLFRTYQDQQSPGGTFYAFIPLGLVSMIHVHILYFLPLFWLFMAFKIQSLSWRTFIASVLGTILPYWFVAAYFAYIADFTLMQEHFEQLVQTEIPIDYSALTLPQMLNYAFLIVITITGTIHYLRTRYHNKIRTRMLFDCFIITAVIAIILLALQPQHITLLMPVIIVCASPLIAHFIALTHTRWTNIAFYVITIAALSLTVVNLWMLLFNS